MRRKFRTLASELGGYESELLWDRFPKEILQAYSRWANYLNAVLQVSQDFNDALNAPVPLAHKSRGERDELNMFMNSVNYIARDRPEPTVWD